MTTDLEAELRALKTTVETQQHLIETLMAERATPPDASYDAAPSVQHGCDDGADTTRRGFFTKALVAGAAGAAGLATTAQPAAAGIGAGTQFTLGEYNQSDETTTLFRSSSSDKTGLAVSVDGNAIAVGGSSNTGRGISGNTDTGTGVQGMAAGGDAVFGQSNGGRSLVANDLSNGLGLSAHSASGVGASVSSETGIPLRIVPGSGIGPPQGEGLMGDIYLDGFGQLFVCVSDGEPGEWQLANAAPGIDLLSTPVRAYDSRPSEPGSGTKGKFAAGETRTIDLGLDAPVIDSDVSVLLNATVTSTTGAGFGAIYTAGSPTLTPPTFSSINWTSTGQTIGNNVQSAVSSAEVKVFTSQATHVILDVVGYVEGAAPIMLALGAASSARGRARRG